MFFFVSHLKKTPHTPSRTYRKRERERERERLRERETLPPSTLYITLVAPPLGTRKYKNRQLSNKALRRFVEINRSYYD